MSSARTKISRPPRPAAGDHSRLNAEVTGFLAKLTHAHRPEIEAVREVILAANPVIEEGIKWNAPSFWCAEWFATFHLRAKGGATVVLHRGAKEKAAGPDRFVDDRHNLLTWITTDRATVTFATAAEVRAKAVAFRAVITAWSTKVAAEVELARSVK